MPWGPDHTGRRTCRKTAGDGSKAKRKRLFLDRNGAVFERADRGGDTYRIGGPHPPEVPSYAEGSRVGYEEDGEEEKGGGFHFLFCFAISFWILVVRRFFAFVDSLSDMML